VKRLGEEVLQAKLASARSDRAERAATDRAKYLEAREADREDLMCKTEEAAMRDGQSADTASDDLQRKVRALQREILEVRHAAGVDGTEGAEGTTAGAGLGALALASADMPAPMPRRRANAEALAAVGAAAAVGAGSASMETQRMVLQQIEAIRALKLRAAEAEHKAADLGREIGTAREAAQDAELERDALQRRLDVGPGRYCSSRHRHAF